MKEFEAVAGLVLDADGELNFLMPADKSEKCKEFRFLLAVFHRANQDPSFVSEQLEWLEGEFQEFQKGRVMQ